ncbi:MAG TPA: SHOCT domain-containing protein [Halothiobacillus sp.]|nr:SHOCT domain-containing protein [Halothiobacillus sp.]HUN00106.1 SHOCT domain-containing protein [Halothiobacillus sp.]
MAFYDHWGMGGVFGGFGLIFMAACIAIVVLIIFAIVRALQGGNGSSASTPQGYAQNQALQILQERYARGEIDETEFNERRRVLGKSG